MGRYARLLFAVAASLATIGQAAAARTTLAPSSEQILPDGQHLLILCYHDVVSARAPGQDPETIETSALASQLDWLRKEGYVAVDLDAVERAYAGTQALPKRAVLLTFDDGYESTYTTVFPLLVAYHTPAVVALVGQWMQTPSSQTVQYGEQQLRRDRFLDWDQARRMQDSGLIEFASHTWDLHHGVAADPGGSLEPAATSHLYLGDGRYEDDAAWSGRLRIDLERNSRLLEQRLGRRPRAIVWPYGRHNEQAERIARDLGMPIGMSLDQGRADVSVPIGRLRRLLVDAAPDTARFARLIRQQDEASVVRAIQFDLAPLAAVDPASIGASLDEAVLRLRRLGARTVVIRACEQAGAGEKTGVAYFPNRLLPLRADLLGRAAWRFATAAGAGVWAWMPLDGCLADPRGEAAGGETRLDALFEDLGKSSYVAGLLLGPADPSDSLLATSARLAQRVRAWQPQLATGLWIDGTDEAALPRRIRSALQFHDFAFVEGSTIQAAGGPSLLGDASARIVAIIATTDASNLQRAASAGDDLVRVGLPNLFLPGSPLSGDASGLAALRSTFSVEAGLRRVATGESR